MGILTDPGQMAFEEGLRRNHQIDSKRENSARGGGRGESQEHRGPTGKRCRKPMGGVEETETEQRLEGEGHLTGNHWQEGVRL